MCPRKKSTPTPRPSRAALSIPASGNGVIVRFVTQPQWFVGGVNAEGKVSYPPNRGELASNGEFTLGGAFRQEDVDNAVKSITQLLQANGFYANTGYALHRAVSGGPTGIHHVPRPGRHARQIHYACHKWQQASVG